MSALSHIANQFQFPGAVDKVSAYGSGLINDTYIVTFANPAPAAHPRYGQHAILQRINRQVFPQPVKVMENLESLLQHVLQTRPDNSSDQDFLLPPLYATQDGRHYVQDNHGDIWRAMAFIEGTKSFETLDSLQQATEVGRILGAFHQRVHDLPVENLHDTLPGFHITPIYLQHFDQTIAAHTRQARSGDAARFCQEVIAANRSLANVLVDARPPLTPRVMHGDPKLNNILFDADTGTAISIIDLDTVKPGLIHYDIGDCLRSCCNRRGELPDPSVHVEFDIDVCQAILEGYASSAASFLELQDLDYLLPAIQLLPFELGLRFYTDYLAGNRYFKVEHADDNLRRAVTQFKLLQSIQQQQVSLRDIIDELRNMSRP